MDLAVLVKTGITMIGHGKLEKMSGDGGFRRNNRFMKAAYYGL